jgi:hypothetical protein
MGHLDGKSGRERPQTMALPHATQNHQEKNYAARRQCMIVQHLPAMVLPLVMRNTKKTTDVAQRRNVNVQDQEMARMPPSINIIKESKDFPRVRA